MFSHTTGAIFCQKRSHERTTRVKKGEVGVRCLCGYGRWTIEPRQATHQHDFQGD